MNKSLIIIGAALSVMLCSCTNKAERYYDQGITKLKERVPSMNELPAKYNTALALFDQAIAENPNYTDAYKKRACVKQALRDFAGATQDAQKVLKLEPGDKAARYFIGRTKYFQKDYTGSLKVFNETLAGDPTFADGYVLRALTEEELPDRNATLKDFDKAIAMVDDNNRLKPNYYVLRAFFKKNSMNDKEGACTDFNRAAGLGDKTGKECVTIYCK